MTARLLYRLLGSAAAVAVVTGAIFLFREAVPVLSLGVLYVFAVLPVAALWGRAYAIAVAVASMLAFNFFFLPPQHTLRLEDGANWFALAVYLVTAVVVSDLATGARRRAAEAAQREHEEALLAELSIALLQGERLTGELDSVAAGVARLLGVEEARLALDGAAERRPDEQALPLTIGGRPVGTLFVPAESALDPAVVERFLPAFTSLLAVALDRAELEREALAAERLRLSDSVKTTILRAVSHDLRSPLTAIRVAAESLASPSVQLDAEDRRRQLETVRKESQRLDRLVANLLDFSRLETAAATPSRQLISTDDLVAQALSELEADEAAVRVEMGSSVPVVEVDSMQIERALVNLLENALRYSPPGEPVTVTLAQAAGEAVLAVTDKGRGIPRDDLERIFEPFEQLSDRGSGTGLGLAIARGFTEANGGRISVVFDETSGTTFSLAFPVAEAVVEAPA
jgi:two-component system, OmpR family, sensor histidine kinase KdpD